ncbi:MAG: bifunctional 3-(3-hydroxy-phenyl)propionate/3-hydroxycinnamic acid hydroxylase [Candidatus Nanopelagicales bacterium]
MTGAPSVLVVGGGPIGVASALMLARRGVPTLVVEKHRGIYPLPRAVHLDDEVYRILADLGVADAFAQITVPTQGLRLVDAALKPMAEFRRSDALGPNGFPPANMFDQPELEVILRDALGSEPLARIAGGTELVDLRQLAGGRVETVLRDLESGEERIEVFDAVLGCDGANSRVRELIGSAYEDLKFEERWLVVDVRSEQPLDTWVGVHQVCDPQRAGTYMQVGPGRYRWEFRLHDDETVDSVVDSGTFERLLSPWLGDVPYASLEIMRRAEYTFRARIADRWASGRVFLLGDAAHLTPPFIGQGLCAGLRDASNLTWKLAAVLQGQASEQLLATYEPERAPHARALILKARMVGWAMTGGQDWAAHVRRVLLAVACRIPGATDKVLDADPPRLAPGLGVQRGGRRDRVSGGLVPQPVVRVGDCDQLLDDATGRGYLVLARGPAGAELRDAARSAGMPLLEVLAPGEPLADGGLVGRTGSLVAWFRHAGATAVLVRPDHVVQARGTAAGGADLADALRRWTREASWQPTARSGHEVAS